MKKSVLFLVLLCSIALLLGCASVGTKMDVSQVQTIQKGVTTRADVEAKLGPPGMASLMGDGRKMIMYNFYEYRTKAATFIPFVGLVAGGANTHMQMLQIMLDQNDVVVDYVFTDAPSEVRMGTGGEAK